jgi:hypothetical protein
MPQLLIGTVALTAVLAQPIAALAQVALDTVSPNSSVFREKPPGDVTEARTARCRKHRSRNSTRGWVRCQINHARLPITASGSVVLNHLTKRAKRCTITSKSFFSLQ